MTDQTPVPTPEQEAQTRREIARVPTAHAQRYLGQLCKHFAHKIPVEQSEREGRIVFGAGVCRATSDEAALTLEIEGTPETMAELRDVVARHLARFAFREDLAIDWRPA